MPTASHDPGLLREQEMPLVIEKNWFLEQEIPAGGFVSIQDSSQVWEERVDETRMITTEGLTTGSLQDIATGRYKLQSEIGPVSSLSV